MAAAQEERATALTAAEKALKEAAEAQHRRARLRNIALVTVSLLALLAGFLERRSNEQRIVAEDILASAMYVIAKFQFQMDSDTAMQAFAAVKRGAEQGNTTAMCNLGYFYGQGLGTTQDYALARAWYEKAAEKGDARAANLLIELGSRGGATTMRR